jgi:hypothetical protein
MTISCRGDLEMVILDAGCIFLNKKSYIRLSWLAGSAVIIASTEPQQFLEYPPDLVLPKSTSFEN